MYDKVPYKEPLTYICGECGGTHQVGTPCKVKIMRDIAPVDTTRKSDRLAIFDKTIQDVENKCKVYGHPRDNFQDIAVMKSVIEKCQDPLVRHTLEMIAEGVCRLIHTPNHLDSWSNIAGYARCGVMVTEPADGPQ